MHFFQAFFSSKKCIKVYFYTEVAKKAEFFGPFGYSKLGKSAWSTKSAWEPGSQDPIFSRPTYDPGTKIGSLIDPETQKTVPQILD